MAMSTPLNSARSSGPEHDSLGSIMRQAGASKRGKKPLFKKSGAKIFGLLGHGHCQRQRPWPSIHKVFLLLFVHKKKP
jgi:hypothetical protein